MNDKMKIIKELFQVYERMTIEEKKLIVEIELTPEERTEFGNLWIEQQQQQTQNQNREESN